MCRKWMFLPTLIELALVLAALLGGAGASHALFPSIIVRLTPGPGVVTSMRETPVPVPASLTAAAAPLRWATGRMRGQDSDPVLAAETTDRVLFPDAAAAGADWRRVLQQLATWPYQTEAPAGAGRYPITVPGGRQRDDLPRP